MSDLTFQEVKGRTKGPVVHRWLIRRESPHTNDGFYTIGKIKRTRRFVRRGEEREWMWTDWTLELNAPVTLERAKTITEFMEAL